MDADDSSDDSRIAEQQTTRRQGRTICAGTQVPGFAGLNHGLQSSDCVILVNVFEVRPIVMKTIPPFLKGTFKTALKASLQEVRGGQHSRDLTTEILGWKLFLLPRILLHRLPRGGLVPKAQLQERVDKFLQGHWVPLLTTSLELSVQGATASCRRRRGQHARSTSANLGNCLRRDKHWWELLSPAGNSRTQKLLQDETRRPPEARSPIDPSIGGRARGAFQPRRRLVAEESAHCWKRCSGRSVPDDR